MKKIVTSLLNLDRRVIYVLMLLAVTLPLFVPMNLPIRISTESANLYQEIEKLKPHDRVVLSFDYEPSSEAEIHPMSEAIIRHCWRKGVRIVVVALIVQGTSLAERAFATVGKDQEFAGKKYGVDYVNLGFCAGPMTGHTQVEMLCNSVPQAFPTDIHGTAISQLPIMQGIQGFKELPLVVSLTSGDPGVQAWVQIAYSRYRIKIGGGSTAVQVPQFMPYLQSRQLCGFLGGLRGAAEYEKLLGITSKASLGMDSQSCGHFFMMFLIILANIAVVVEKRK